MIDVGGTLQEAADLQESEARLHALLSSLDDLVFELDESGTYLGVWTTNDRLLAAPRQELLGRSVRDVIGEELGLRLIQLIGRVIDTACPEILEFCLDVPAGTRWFQGRLAPIAGSRGSSRTVCLLVRDTTAQKAAEQEILRLLSREQLLSRLSEALPLGLFEIDMAGHVVFTNDRLHRILGVVAAATIEDQMSSMIADDQPLLEAALAAVLAEHQVDDIELRFRLAETGAAVIAGAERVCRLSLRALTDPAGVMTGAVGCLSDVTEHVHLRHQLETRASIDELTSCLNRAALLELVNRTTAAPNADGVGNALIFIDLDQFKSVNDRFGHAAGDRLLAAAADRFRAAVRDCDEIGRIGGDEFVVVCPRVASPAQAVSIARRVAAAAATATVDVGPAAVELQTSIGVTWTTEALDADAFIAQADSAMYNSKRTNGIGVSLFTASGRDAISTPLRHPPRTRRHPPS